MKVIRITVVLVFLYLTGGAGAAPSEEWNKTFGVDGQAHFVQQTSEGGYILAGVTNNSAWLIKTDVNGSEQWNKTIGEKSLPTSVGSVQTSGNRTSVDIKISFSGGEAKSVQQTLDGGYILAGGTGIDSFLIKTDAYGNPQWMKTFEGGKDLWGASVQQTSDGGYIFASGYTGYIGERAAGLYVDNAWLIKTDINGNMQWNKTFGGRNGSHANSVQQTSDGGYIIGGYTTSYITTGEGVNRVTYPDKKYGWLIKTDSQGNEQWDKTFRVNGDDSPEGNSVQQTSDGSYIFAGHSDSGSWLIKIDPNGNEQWNKTMGAQARSIRETAEGGFILAASQGIIKTDENGNEQWNIILAGDMVNILSVQQTKEGGYILAGWKNLFPQNAWLIKVGERAETKTPTANLTEKAETTKAPTANATEKAAGFELILAMITLLAVHMFMQKR